MINVLIADDHNLMRKGLRHILMSAKDIKVLDEAENGKDVIGKIRNMDINLLLLDISMPDIHGIDLLDKVKFERPDLPVLILTMFPEEIYAIRAIKAGASGYVTKESAPDELIDAIHKVASGSKYISPSLAVRLADLVNAKGESLPHEALSPREIQVLRLMANGKTISEIAEYLSISVKTVSTHRTHVLEKLELKNNAELIRYALENNMV
jgi:DNA-binding NarL/FixJ family response regulator